jgi:transcriptional regulator with PAS, ATPase and Fis domain
MHNDHLAKFKAGVHLLWSQGLKEDARKFEEEAKAKGLKGIGSCHTEEWLDRFITVDEDMLKLKDEVRVLSQINDPVLIRGETGTGKELLAQALHGSRAGKFVAVNCPAVSIELMESEFFGHVKGAFTGAMADKVGKFQYAFNGTLFIDEVGDMPPSMQSLLLRTLQEKMICRVGANEEIAVNPRIVCATNKPLEEMIQKGTFRLDLLHRLNTFELRTKPLWTRLGDIELIIQTFDKTKKFPPYQGASLDGNVRELLSLIRRWQVLGR